MQATKYTSQAGERTHYTPGPWSYWPNSAGGVVTQDSTANHIAIPCTANKEGNARLIAAAPELLAALEYFKGVCDDSPPMELINRIGEAYHKAKSAIAKAIVI